MKYILLLACITIVFMTVPVLSQRGASIAAAAAPKQGDLLQVTTSDRVFAKDFSETVGVSSPVQALFFNNCHCPEPSTTCGGCKKMRCIMACFNPGLTFKLCTYCSKCEASSAGFNPNLSCFYV